MLSSSYVSWQIPSARCPASKQKAKQTGKRYTELWPLLVMELWPLLVIWLTHNAKVNSYAANSFFLWVSGDFALFSTTWLFINVAL